jgi:hypothetical protein
MSLNKNEISSLLRRLYRVDELVYNQLKPYRIFPGKFNKSPLEFLDYIRFTVINEMFILYFEHLDEQGEEWESIEDMLMEYITSEHGEKIKEFYQKRYNR